MGTRCGFGAGSVPALGQAFLDADVCRPERKAVEQSGVMEVTGWAVPAGVSHRGGGKGRACRPLAFAAHIDSEASCVLQHGRSFASTKLSWSSFALCFGLGPAPYGAGSLFGGEETLCFLGGESPSDRFFKVRGSSAPGPAVLRSFWEQEEREARQRHRLAMEGAHLTIRPSPWTLNFLSLLQPLLLQFSILAPLYHPGAIPSLPPRPLSFFGVYILQILAGCYNLPCSPSSARAGSCLSLTCWCKPVLPDITYVPGCLELPPVPLPGQLRA